MTDDVYQHNRHAWNRQSRSGTSRWCEPVSTAVTGAARNGNWQVILTPCRPVPRDWFGAIGGSQILCLASAGGQQAPVLAAAGARVVSLDASDEQLALDRTVAERDGLDVLPVRGNMTDLGCFPDRSFDLIFHPVSNVFVADVRPVWWECYRVLRPGGRLLAGFMNPDFYLFDHEAVQAGGAAVVTFTLPYADTEQLTPERLLARKTRGDALEFGHSLDHQIGGQLDAGFLLTGFYEDRWDPAATPLDRFMPTSMATCALKPS